MSDKRHMLSESHLEEARAPSSSMNGESAGSREGNQRIADSGQVAGPRGWTLGSFSSSSATFTLCFGSS